MKAIFIAFDQAYYERLVENLPQLGCRGFTAWQEVQGRGSKTGDPHMCSHAWPTLNSAILTVVDDEQASALLRRLKEVDDDNPMLGIRAFQWSVEASI